MNPQNQYDFSGLTDGPSKNVYDFKGVEVGYHQFLLDSSSLSKNRLHLLITEIFNQDKS